MLNTSPNPPLVVGITGGSASGKSWLAGEIQDRFPGKSTLVSQDWYYRDLSHLDLAEASQTNFDHPDSIELELFVEQLTELKKGTEITAPDYRFSTYSRVHDAHLLAPQPLIIVEGLFVLHYLEICKLLDISIFIDVPDEVRLERRLGRDTQERGYSEETIRRAWERHARPMFERFVLPSAKQADHIWKSLEDKAFVPRFLADLEGQLARNGD